MTRSKLSAKNNYLDINKLIEDYSPLMKSIYKKFAKFNNLYHSYDDYEDLEAQIQFEFVKLCKEYNPTRGVDFPGFIKFHLQQRVYHHVTRLQRTRQKETVAYGREYDGEMEESVNFDNLLELADEDADKEFEKVEAIASLDWTALQSKKHKWLVEAILLEQKSLEEIAKEEGVSLKVIRLRLYSVCNILIEHATNMDEIYRDKLIQLRQESMKGLAKHFNIVRKPIITRKPIYLEENHE